jgi:heparan-sulfate lyase
MPLKCGATAEWHNQPDNGTFELYAYGRNLMTDSGGGGGGCYLYGSSDAGGAAVARRGSAAPRRTRR